MKTFISLILLSISLSSFAQAKFAKSAIKFFDEVTDDLSTIEASCESLDFCYSFSLKRKNLENDDFFIHVKEYQMNASKDELFDALTKQHPKNIWNGDSNFQLSYSPSDNKQLSKDDEHTGIVLGEVILLDLNIKIGKLSAASMPVAFKIVEIDREAGVLAFSYAKRNKSKGIQHLRVEEKDGFINIVHTSRFLSNGGFRDKLYPKFHEQLVDEFYAQLTNLIDQSRELVI